MSPDRPLPGAAVLRVVLGGVVLVQSMLALTPEARPRHALLAAILPVLASVEILGAALLLLPRTARWGARVLMGVFVAAMLLHALHGEWNVGALLVYTAAAWTIQREEPVPSPAQPPAG